MSREQDEVLTVGTAYGVSGDRIFPVSREQKERPFSAWSAIRSALSLAIDAYTSSMQYEACSARLDDIARQCDELIAENTRAQLAAAGGERDAARERARSACQTIVGVIGAPGPTDVDEAANRIAATLTMTRQEYAALRTHAERAESDRDAAIREVAAIGRTLGHEQARAERAESVVEKARRLYEADEDYHNAMNEGKSRDAELADDWREECRADLMASVSGFASPRDGQGAG